MSCSAAQVEQVGLVVLRLRPSAVDHQDLEARDVAGRRRSASGTTWRAANGSAAKQRTSATAQRSRVDARRASWCGRDVTRATVAAAPRGRNSHAAACRGPGSGRGGLDADRAPVGRARVGAGAPPLGAAPDRTRRRPRARPRKPADDQSSSNSMSIADHARVTPSCGGAHPRAGRSPPSTEIVRTHRVAPRRPCAKRSPGRQRAMRPNTDRVGHLAPLAGAAARRLRAAADAAGGGGAPGWARHVPGEPSAEPRTDPAGRRIGRTRAASWHVSRCGPPKRLTVTARTT